MTRYAAPAKLNLSLHVSPPDASGMHPLESLVQTIDLLDEVDVSVGATDEFSCSGADLDPEDNLVVAALQALRRTVEIPPVAINLRKRIPLEAGLGGGSSDAAATLAALVDLTDQASAIATDVAPGLGADVPLFLAGGTQMMTGFGEVVSAQPSLSGFAVAVVVPQFGLGTADVYRRWDELEGPLGPTIPDQTLPPQLRGSMPLRNDLVPAAIDLEPQMGDFISAVSGAWSTPVAMTGSGAACFSFFSSVDEASDAASSIEGTRGSFGLALRNKGVAEIETHE